MSNVVDGRWSRRALLKGGVLSTLACFPWRLQAAAESLATLPLITKAIPRSGERLPALGIGSNRFENAPYENVRAVLSRMHELGGTLIDTAAGYGDSEAIIGRALSELNLKQQMFIATKFNSKGATLPLPPGSPPVGENEVYGQAAFDRSLMRLGVDRVDLLFAHFLSSLEPLMPLMTRLKKAGKTRYVGTTVGMLKLHEPLAEMIQKYPLDFVQVDYSIANRDAANNVFPAALAHKTAVMVDQPLGGRAWLLEKQMDGVPLPSWAADIDVTSWNQFFLKYVISHPAVTCVIPGTTSIDHLVDNQLAGHGRLPDAAMRREMEQFWDAHAKEPTRPS